MRLLSSNGGNINFPWRKCLRCLLMRACGPQHFTELGRHSHSVAIRQFQSHTIPCCSLETGHLAGHTQYSAKNTTKQ